MKSKDKKSNSSSISTSSIEDIVDHLKYQRVRNSTKKNYHSVWRGFSEFYLKLDWKPSEWEECITLFVGYLIEVKKAKSQTIRSYISALKATLLNDGIKLSEDNFY